VKQKLFFFALQNVGPVFAEYAGVMKTVVSKVNRSGVYYLITTVAPNNEGRNARFDIWGVVTVVVLLLGVVGLVRLVLSL